MHHPPNPLIKYCSLRLANLSFFSFGRGGRGEDLVVESSSQLSTNKMRMRSFGANFPKKEIPKWGKQPRVPGWHPTPSHVASRPGPSLAALILATQRRRECFRAFAAAFAFETVSACTSPSSHEHQAAHARHES
jgi:hypothetical protein